MALQEGDVVQLKDLEAIADAFVARYTPPPPLHSTTSANYPPYPMQHISK